MLDYRRGRGARVRRSKANNCWSGFKGKFVKQLVSQLLTDDRKVRGTHKTVDAIR